MMAFSKTYPCIIFPLAAISFLCLMGKSPVDASTLKTDKNWINITYPLRIGDGEIPSEWYQMSLLVHTNMTFHSIMKIAARRDSHYEFSEIEYSFGYYITEINGVAENVTTSQFWMLYISPNPFLPEVLPGDELLSPVGVSDLMPNDGDNIMFWYKTVIY